MSVCTLLPDALVQSSFLVQAILGEVAAEHDLSVTQVRLLGVLRDRELRMAQLAQLLGLSRSSTTGLVDRAQQRGLVERVEIPVGDERAVHVRLSESGRQLARAGTAEVADRLGEVVDGLSDRGRERLSRLLTKVVIRDAEARGLELTPNRAETGERRPQ